MWRSCILLASLFQSCGRYFLLFWETIYFVIFIIVSSTNDYSRKKTTWRSDCSLLYALNSGESPMIQILTRPKTLLSSSRKRSSEENSWLCSILFRHRLYLNNPPNGWRLLWQHQHPCWQTSQYTALSQNGKLSHGENFPKTVLFQDECQATSVYTAAIRTCYKWVLVLAFWRN